MAWARAARRESAAPGAVGCWSPSGPVPAGLCHPVPPSRGANLPLACFSPAAARHHGSWVQDGPEAEAGPLPPCSGWWLPEPSGPSSALPMALLPLGAGLQCGWTLVPLMLSGPDVARLWPQGCDSTQPWPLGLGRGSDVATAPQSVTPGSSAVLLDWTPSPAARPGPASSYPSPRPRPGSSRRRLRSEGQGGKS